MSVVAAAFAPMTPLLLPHLSGAADPLAELREAAVAAVRDACAGADEVVVLCPVGGREAPGEWHDPARPGTRRGPLAGQVGAHLLDLAGATLPRWYADVPGTGVVDGTVARDGRVALLVLGDGAAARGQAAPGHIDDRSFGFDDHVAALVAAGDGMGLAGVDLDLAAALMATGRLSWPVAGALVPTAEAELRWRGDPFGVTYLVAVWRV